MKKWLAKRKQERLEQRFRDGYNFAAGSLLRGDATPQGLENFVFDRPDAFDRGMECAISRLVVMGAVEDDRFQEVM